MDLFNEVYNRYFQLVFNIINECEDGLEKGDILKIIDEGEFEQKALGRNGKSFSSLMLNACGEEDSFRLLTERDGLFYASVENPGTPPLPVRFSNPEKAWLSAMLQNSEAGLILSEGTLDKLRKELQDFDSPVREEYFELTNRMNLPDIPDADAYKTNFRTVLDAIMQEKPIRYTNTDKKGNVYRDRPALPVSIEYSMRDGRFRVSMYSLDERRPIMANLSTMSGIVITDGDPGITREEAKRLLYEQKYCEEPVVLEVTDKKAAMERCFMCFSGMERTARELGDNKYEMRLSYYMFEEEDLIRSIISLGPYVRVVSPKRIIDEIKARVKRAIELYSGTE